MKKKLIFIIPILLCLAFSVVAAINHFCIKNVKYDNATEYYSCTFRGRTRKFLMFLPEDYKSRTEQEKSEIRLILMLHGAGESGLSFKNKTEFNTDALPRNFALLYVNSIPVTKKGLMNANWHYGTDKDSRNDVDFLRKITRYVQRQYKLNHKIFAVGFSNGGFMINKLAVSNPEYYTAVASVSGMMPDTVWKCRPQNGDIGYLQINGTKDDIIPRKYESQNMSNPNPLMEDVIDYWVKANKLPAEKETIPLSEMSTLENYSNKVQWIQIKDAVHGWTSESYAKININNTILNFFDSF